MANDLSGIKDNKIINGKLGIWMSEYIVKTSLLSLRRTRITYKYCVFNIQYVNATMLVRDINIELEMNIAHAKAISDLA